LPFAKIVTNTIRAAGLAMCRGSADRPARRSVP